MASRRSIFDANRIMTSNPMMTESCPANDGSEQREDTMTHDEAAPALAGNILPFIDKLIISPKEAKAIVQEIYRLCQWQDILIIVVLGWCFVPIVEIYYNNLTFSKDRVPYRESRVFHVATLISQIGQIALIVYVVDVMDIARATMGISFMDKLDLPVTSAKLIYTVWAANKIMKFKHYLLMKYMAESKQKVGLAHLIDHMINGMLGCITMFSIVDILDIEGAGLKSAITFGSAGTLAFTLASQSIVSAIVNGFALSASNRFYVGELVKFGDGTSGTVVKLGWMETVLRSSDNLVVAVPNTQLAGQRVMNLSRNKMCQIKLMLKFHYKDMKLLPPFTLALKETLKRTCPELISDGARPFRVLIHDLLDTHIEVMVDTHYNIPPIGDVYYNNRQHVLMIIYECIKQHGLELVVFKYPTHFQMNQE